MNSPIAVYCYLPAKGRRKPFYCGQSLNPKDELRNRLRGRNCNRLLKARIRAVGVRLQVLSWHRLEDTANKAEARAVRKLKTWEGYGGCNRTKDGAGLFPIQNRKEHRKASAEGGRLAQERGIGIFSQTKEDLAALGRRSGRLTLVQGMGIRAQTKEERATFGRITLAREAGIHSQTRRKLVTLGHLTYQKKLGIHAQTREEHAALGQLVVRRKLGAHAQTKKQLATLGRRTPRAQFRRMSKIGCAFIAKEARERRNALSPQVSALRAKGLSGREIGKIVGVGHTTVYRILAEK